MMPQQAQGGMPPELEQMIEQGKQQIEEMGKQLEKLQADLQMAKIESKGKDIEAQSLRAELHLKGVMDTQRKQAGAMQQSMQPQQSQSPVSISMPENIGASVAEAIVPAVTQAVTQAIQQIPPLQVQMPPQRLKRKIPVRDQSGLITETREEFIPEEMVN
jgi:regulator of replication initiation timing